jgi:hypothetical protein
MGGDEKKVKGELPRTDGSYPTLYLDVDGPGYSNPDVLICLLCNP